LYYSGDDIYGIHSIGALISNDGLTFTESPSNPILYGENFSIPLGAVDVKAVNNGTVYMVHQSSKGINLMTSNNFFNWTDPVIQHISTPSGRGWDTFGHNTPFIELDKHKN